MQEKRMKNQFEKFKKAYKNTCVLKSFVVY